MALIFYDSPFHVTHDEETANEMSIKMDLVIKIQQLIKSKKHLKISRVDISDLMNDKIEKFSVDYLVKVLNAA